MNKQTVLIVDDKPEKREVLAEYILALGHQVREAENGLLGLAEARVSRPDLILLDLSMPEMDGLQFLAERKQDSLLREIPVIVITARESSEYSVAECLQQGAEDILKMPPEFEVLRARIENSLARRRQQIRESELRNRLERLLLNVNEAEQKADRLLHSIFPKEAVQELKETNTIVPRRYDDVAVLFCDIVAFTKYSEAHPPGEVVEKLERLVEAQEEVADRHGVQKVKTIGDAFMAVAGLQHPGDGAVLDCVRCGLEITGLPAKLELPWQLRVGISAGPVVGGKLGRQKFAYDLWGDAVNTADRIQNAAAPDTVLVDPAVWSRVSSKCRGASQGLIDLKGKGQKELFRVDEVVKS